MATPLAAERHDLRVGSLTALVVAGVRRAWRRLEPSGSIEQQYQESVGPQILALVLAAQIASASESDSYVARVLAELLFPSEEREGSLNPRAFAGWAGDGRPVASLLASNVGSVRALASRGTSVEQALRDAEAEIEEQVATLIADATRAAEVAAMATYPSVTHYVRMIEPGACSRCAVLAGRKYRLEEAFERHPRCRCTHIPATENIAGSVVTDSQVYFDSLSRAEQDRIFTAAGATAIRDGADIARVVNARRGMRKAQVYGREVLITGRVNRGSRIPVRLMPETIVAGTGGDVAERTRLLKLHGYIL